MVYLSLFFLIGIHYMQGWKALQGIELQEKEAQKDYSIQEFFLERTTVIGVC